MAKVETDLSMVMSNKEKNFLGIRDFWCMFAKEPGYGNICQDDNMRQRNTNVTDVHARQQ